MANKDTKWLYFTGTCEFYRNKTTDSYGNYCLKMILDDPEAYKASGIQVTLGEDNSVWFRRAKVKLMNNELVELGAPKTINAEEEPIDVLVGKGSRIEAKVKTFPTMKGQGHTLEGVKVFELVEVDSDYKTW